PDLRYLLVGSISPSYDVRAAIARAGLEDSVTVTGYVDRAAFEDYVAAADICVNLRHPTAGETSASLLRLLGAGRPTLVTASGSFAELPHGVAAQVDADASEGELIVAYCRLLLDRPALAAQLGANAHDYVAREHSLEGAAEGYMRFLAGRYGWGEVRKIREMPLWPLETENREPRTENREESQAQIIPSHSQQFSASSILHSQFPDVAEALASMGATEDDRPLIEGAARAMRELMGDEHQQ
ncbi:MAG TPA: glycosyltransferase, partial [Roseiflexaceae bacterium]|nr:glycosyltransferase [Roseiflexaceae bacterium]